MKNLITGGAGFIGVNLIQELLKLKENVICLDNFSTGLKINLKRWENNPLFQYLDHDITNPIDIKVDRVWHLACPASPYYYQKDPIKTSKINFLGTYNALEIARNNEARILFTSSSEIYGNSKNNIQSENDFGNINPIGRRSCYGEGKRIGETLFYDFKRIHNIDIRVARLFNIYGPNMFPYDGRVISNFIVQALRNKPITVYGDGSQTRSFCYIDDLILGITKLMDSKYSKPVNFGNPYSEFKIMDIALIIREKINPKLSIQYKELPEDDPLSRSPDINVAKNSIFWEPKISFNKGLEYTINYFKKIIV